MLRPLPRILVPLALAAALVVPATASAHAGDAVTLEGTLEFTHSDNFRTKQANYYYALRQGKNTTRLSFGQLAQGSAERDEAPRARPARARLARRRAPAQAAPLADPRARHGSPRSRAASPCCSSTSRTTAASRGRPRSAATTMFTARARSPPTSRGVVRLDLDDRRRLRLVPLPTSSGGCAIDSWAASANAAAAAAGVNLSSYQHVVYAFPYVMDCGWAGPRRDARLARLDQRLVRAPHARPRALAQPRRPPRRVAQLQQRRGEGALGTTCSYSEYGDPFDVMGQGSRHTSAWHKGQIGWLDPLAQQTVDRVGHLHDHSAGVGLGRCAVAPDPARSDEQLPVPRVQAPVRLGVRQLQRQRPGGERRHHPAGAGLRGHQPLVPHRCEPDDVVLPRRAARERLRRSPTRRTASRSRPSP